MIKPPVEDDAKGKGKGKQGERLSQNKLMEFTTVLRHYMNFLQKQRVSMNIERF